MNGKWKILIIMHDAAKKFLSEILKKFQLSMVMIDEGHSISNDSSQMGCFFNCENTFKYVRKKSDFEIFQQKI